MFWVVVQYAAVSLFAVFLEIGSWTSGLFVTPDVPDEREMRKTTRLEVVLQSWLTGSSNRQNRVLVHGTTNSWTVDEITTKFPPVLKRLLENTHPTLVLNGTLQAVKAGPANYTAERGRLAALQDPRAYQISTMTPEQIQTLQKSLKGVERAKFNASLKSAVESGVVTPPGQ